MTETEVMDPLPVRTRLTLLRDGSTAVSEIVFCEPRAQSVPLAQCASCRFGGRLERDAAGNVTVGCCRFTLPSSRSVPDPPASGPQLRGTGAACVAATVPVGLSLVRPVVCVAYDAPLRIAARGLELESSAYGMAVVDEQDRFVGTLPRAKAALALLRSSPGSVAEHMTSEWGSADEAQSLGEAFAAMTARHARELVVLGEGRAVVGMIRDIDALRFVAYVSRTGLRPPVDRAA